MKTQCRGKCCKHDVKICGATFEPDGFTCTLPKRHVGHHIACGCHGHDLKIWKRNKK